MSDDAKLIADLNRMASVADDHAARETIRGLIVPVKHLDAPRVDPFAVTVRLMWIDGVIDNDGEINRSDIARAFGISTQQASNDLRRYMELNPGRIAYDVFGKCYVQVEGSRPLYRPAQQEAAAEMVRQVESAILRALEGDA